MKLLLLVTSLTLIAAQPISFQQADTLWQTFKRVHDRNYLGEMDTNRKQIFLQNVLKIEKHNREADFGRHSYWLGINQFTDMTNDEFRKFYNGYKPLLTSKENATTFLAPENLGALPSRVDWRPKGYVTPVKNQLQCGSCWAFSSTGSLEGQNFRKTGKLVSLSEQNLVDCATPEGTQGCNGGWMDDAFKYVLDNKGLDTEQSYPYEGKQSLCRFRRETVGATVLSYTDVYPRNNESTLKTAVATQGPISIAIDASHSSFQLYSHGVYDEPECSTTEVDHAVLIVGYGTDQGQDYWIVKNSWSTTWGMRGYIHMSRNKGNQCGIASHACFPIV